MEMNELEAVISGAVAGEKLTAIINQCRPEERAEVALGFAVAVAVKNDWSLDRTLDYVQRMYSFLKVVCAASGLTSKGVKS